MILERCSVLTNCLENSTKENDQRKLLLLQSARQSHLSLSRNQPKIDKDSLAPLLQNNFKLGYFSEQFVNQKKFCKSKELIKFF